MERLYTADTLTGGATYIEVHILTSREAFQLWTHGWSLPPSIGHFKAPTSTPSVS